VVSYLRKVRKDFINYINSRVYCHNSILLVDITLRICTLSCYMFQYHTAAFRCNI